MIPIFPEFKKIELSDKEEIENFTRQYLPYSDFNFASMWSWDVKEGMRVSKLNGNLIIKFTGYLTGDAHYSFIGNENLDDTISKLLNLSKQDGLLSNLKYIPEDAIKNLDPNVFTIKEDRDNFDYIISVDLLSNYNTYHTRSRRKSANQFLRQYPAHIVKKLDLSDEDTVRDIYDFFDTSDDEPQFSIESERKALSRFITNSHALRYFSLGIFIDDKMVALYIGEFMGEDFTIGHFWKSNTKVSSGLYAYLMQKVAQFCGAHGYKYINIEQDLGLDNLRKWKMSYGTNFFLKKYEIGPK